MKVSLIACATGEVTQSSRVLRVVKPYDSYFAPIPAIFDNAAGVKLVSFCPGNADLDIHTRKATTPLLELETDEPLAIMQGAGTSDWRTAAVLEATTRPDARHSQSSGPACKRAHMSKRCGACATSGKTASGVARPKDRSLHQTAWLRRNVRSEFGARRRCNRHRDQLAGTDP
tara:strand:- start:574 stop:1092 length:519 start_codon:yes stop_codon:yes gene_type:complete